MTRMTTPEATRRHTVRSAAQHSAARIAAAAVTMALMIAGCGSPPEAVTQLPPATQTQTAGPGTGRPFTEPPQPTQPPTPTQQAQPAPAPSPAIPVRPATPPARAPEDPAPRFLSVQGTTISMPIVEVGVSPDGAMVIPEPFNEAGWYRFGPAPGAAAGTAVVAAHVDTTSDSAPFSQLKSLAAGTLVTVQREGAAPLTFRVTGVELMAKNAFDGASVFRRDGPPQLKLVTCGGRWLDEQQDYGDNVIVTADPA
ncbi:hypothetical protein BJG92_01677 [Arthrobacter sp. SO5]|uniref:class F sortase n=1 Tax=Arthrobacter sp. SO5 TaxID=1897055 RepID=UPI001E31976C|nr:class F sortase [Arthrobacter sp. SO5]MCB5274150.1 hypothetical protein [Arthrobacter sp. SO5]